MIDHDHQDRASRFEDWVFKAMDLDPSILSKRELGRTYRSLSEKLIKSSQTPDFANPAESIVWGLIFTARSFHLARRLFSTYPKNHGTFIELGSGWGPFGLAARFCDEGNVILVDQSSSRLGEAERLYRSAQVNVPQTECSDLDRYRIPSNATSVAAPFLMGELNTDPVRQTKRWLSQMPEGGRLYLVEPGTKEGSKRIRTIRDVLVEKVRILSPCTGVRECPMKEEDWCHFTWRAPLGPFGRSIADSAGRKSSSIHFSLLILEKRDPDSTRVDQGRVIDVRPLGKPKTQARVCTSKGIKRLTALRRTREAFDLISQLKPASLISFSSVRELGDGIRIESPEEITVLCST